MSAKPRPRVAFHAPMKPPDHPNPSGDRQIARLTRAALERAGFAPFTASHLRTLDMTGDASAQADLIQQADTEAARIIETQRADPPALWFTYHCYYKAPDLIGPQVSQALQVPYVISEPSLSPSRRDGPWAKFAARSEHAIGQSDRLFWTTERDRPALEAAGHGAKMVHLPAFLDLGNASERQPPTAANPLKLLTVAMMRPGDKVESYRRLAAALPEIEVPWHLTIIGDGPARAEVEALFAAFDSIAFLGRIDDPDRLAAAYRDADLFIWPGVGEGVGMVYLEAQATGLPVVAECHPGPAALIAERCTPPDTPQALASAIVALAPPDRHKHASRRARDHVEQHHSIDAAAAILRRSINEILR